MPTPTRKAPIINAPWPVTAFAVFLMAVHLIRVLLPDAVQNAVFFNGALIPERFWATPDAPSLSGLPGYASAIDAFVPMIASAFIHADWMHVILNAAFLVALAKPVLEIFRRVWPGREPAASILLLGLFLFAQVCSALAYLAASYPDGGPVVGASGGISGLVASVLLLREGPDRWLLSRQFLIASALFVIGNALFAFLGPSLLGASIAWQSHIGGYAGGAVFMRCIVWLMRAGRPGRG